MVHARAERQVWTNTPDPGPPTPRNFALRARDRGCINLHVRPLVTPAAMLRILASVACASALVVASATLLGRGLERTSSWTGPDERSAAKVTLADEPTRAPVTLGGGRAGSSSPIGAIAGVTAMAVPTSTGGGTVLGNRIDRRADDNGSRRTAGRTGSADALTSPADVEDLRAGGVTITLTVPAPSEPAPKGPGAFDSEIQPEETPGPSVTRAQTIAETVPSTSRLREICDDASQSGADAARVCDKIAQTDPGASSRDRSPTALAPPDEENGVTPGDGDKPATDPQADRPDTGSGAADEVAGVPGD